MADFGFEFETKSGRKFRLDNISPCVFIKQERLHSQTTYYYSYPQFAGKAELGFTLDVYDESGYPGSTFSSVADIENGTLAVTASNNGEWYRMDCTITIYARML